MSLALDISTLGMLVVQHHEKKWPISTRSVLFAGRAVERDAETGDYVFGENTKGDVLGTVLWEADLSQRKTSAWAMSAWAAVAGDGPGASDGEGDGSGAPPPSAPRPPSAGFSFSGVNLNFSSGNAQAGASFSGVRNNFSNGGGGSGASFTDPPAGKDLNQGTYGFGRPPATTNPPGNTGAPTATPTPPTNPKCGHAPTPFTVLPIADGAYTGDGRFKAKSIDPPKKDGDSAWGKMPKGTYGIVMATTEEYTQTDLFFPTDRRLIAVNFAGDHEMGSPVADLTDKFEIDLDRMAHLQSALRVLKLPPGEKHNALGFQLGPSGCGDTRGGYFVDRALGTGDGSHKVIGQGSVYEGGPLDCGTGLCKHRRGMDQDGNQYCSLHISTNALFRMDDVFDGPLRFEKPYQSGYDRSSIVPVHLGWTGIDWAWWTTTDWTWSPPPPYPTPPYPPPYPDTPVPPPSLPCPPTDSTPPSPTPPSPTPPSVPPGYPPVATTDPVKQHPDGTKIELDDPPSWQYAPVIPSAAELTTNPANTTFDPTAVQGAFIGSTANVASPGNLAHPQNTDPASANTSAMNNPGAAATSKYNDQNPITGNMQAYGAQGGTTDGYTYPPPPAPPTPPPPAPPPAPPPSPPSPSPSPPPPTPPTPPPPPPPPSPPTPPSTPPDNTGGENDPWAYTQRPGDGAKYHCGTANGGWCILPPEVSLQDAPYGFRPPGVTLSTTYFMVGPSAYFGAGTPNQHNGGLDTGYSWGVDVDTGHLIFRCHAADSVANDAVRFTNPFQNIAWRSGTAAWGEFDHANTADRTYFFPDITGDVMVSGYIVDPAFGVTATLGAIDAPGPTVAAMWKWVYATIGGVSGFIPMWH